jgi:hypothetical protein
MSTPDKKTPTIDPRLVFLDLETTGLDPKHNTILEIGLLVVDLTGAQPPKRFSGTLGGNLPSGQKMDPFVENMHKGNGLFEDIRRRQRADVAAEQVHGNATDRARALSGYQQRRAGRRVARITVGITASDDAHGHVMRRGERAAVAHAVTRLE